NPETSRRRTPSRSARAVISRQRAAARGASRCMRPTRLGPTSTSSEASGKNGSPRPAAYSTGMPSCRCRFWQVSVSIAAAEIVTVAADAASGGRGAPPRRRGLVPAARRLYAGGRGPAGPERGPDLTFRSPGPSISVSTETDEIDEAHAGRRALRAPLGRDGHPLGHQPHRGADPGPALPVAPAPQGR